jgi:HK97 family phage prohead protease
MSRQVRPPHGVATRFVSTVPQSYDADSRTVEVVISRGSPVRRFYGTEVLRIDSKSVILDRLSGGGIPVLDSHQQVGISNSIGLLQRAWFERGGLIGRIAFHDTPEGRRAEGMVRRGEVRGVSAGYRVEEWEITNEDGDIIDPEVDRMRWDDDLTFTAVKWELLEASLVSVPADADAAVRSLKDNIAVDDADDAEDEEDDDRAKKVKKGDAESEEDDDRKESARATRRRMRARQGMIDRSVRSILGPSQIVRTIRRRMEMRQRTIDRSMKYDDFRDGADDPPVSAGSGSPAREDRSDSRSGVLRRVAIHEAGHATVALAQGRKIGFATVVPGEGFLGKVSGDDYPETLKDLMDLLCDGRTSAETEAAARAHVVEYLAGRIAEWMFATAESWMSDRAYSASSDLKWATAFARAICGSNEAAEELLAHSRTEARQIMEANSHVVLAIADALVERGTLSGDEIDVLVRSER